MRKELKELTEASLFLALYTVLLTINQFILAGNFDIFIVLFIGVIVFYHYLKYQNIKYLLMFGITFVMISLLLSSISTMVFAVPMVLVGFIFAYFYIRKINKYFPIIIAGSVLACSEFIASIFILPFFGFKIETMIMEINEIFNLFSFFNFKMPDILFLLIFSLVLTGFMQSLLIYLLIENLIYRFNDLKNYNYKSGLLHYQNPLLANLLLIILILTYIFQNNLNNGIIYMITVMVFAISLINLTFFAYMFLEYYVNSFFKSKKIFLLFFIISLMMNYVIIVYALIGYLSLLKLERKYKWKNLKD